MDYLLNIYNEAIAYVPLIVVGFIFVIGFLSTFLPILPGNLIVWLGILLHKLWLQEASVSWTFVTITGGLTLLAFVLDWLCTYWGARRFGATWRGALGAVIGGIVGIFLPPPLLWIIIGPIIGAVVAEMISGRAAKEAGKAGVGTIVGGLVSFLLKIGIASFSIGWFYLTVLEL